MLFTSGYSAIAAGTDSVQQLEVRVLQKPYDPNDLLREVREILDSCTGLRQLS